MKKKPVKKTNHPRSKNTSSHVLVGLSVILVGFAAFYLFLNVFIMPTTGSSVLGQSILLAHDGESSSGSNDSDSSESSSDGGTNSSGTSGGISEKSTIPNTSSGSFDERSKNTGTNGGSSSNEQSVQDDAVVTCTGPDGKTFQTTFATCQQLNKAWGHSVQFQIVPFAQNTSKDAAPRHSIRETHHTSLEIQSKDGEHLDLGQDGTEVKIGSDNGRLRIEAQKPDGTEVELEDDSLKKVGDALEQNNQPRVEEEDGAFVLRQGSVSARTHFPLSINFSTNQLVVNTPSGERELHVLPAQAISNLLAHGIITQTEKTDVASSSVTLTEKQNEPVFEIPGISQQRFLGLVPVNIHKSVDVSTQNGQVISENETFDQRLLDLLSF